VLATAGYAFTNDWRLEAELGYRQNETTSGTAQVDEWSLMVNALYDIDVSHSWGLTLGVGAGYDSANFDVLGLADQDDGNFAYQGIAGLNVAVGSRTDLTLTYRYLRISEPEFEFGTPPASATFAFDDVTKHTLTLGLRYDLYPDAVPPPPAPPAPPPPPPPPPPANFVIFFGFGKCNITPEADAVLSEAAAAAKSRGSASVQIVGHTDSVGSAKANQKLSECRADAAKANLVGKGVADGAISTSGKGEGELLVQTGDNVKEPQNRRATVDLR
jgi:outer membrane protein OmpA-like peptidoglycan-associated protein